MRAKLRIRSDNRKPGHRVVTMPAQKGFAGKLKSAIFGKAIC